jgi:hypothetical protein
MLVMLCPLMLVACALGDVSSATSQPPITLAPPPALVLSGNCDDTKALEFWLQVTSQLVSDFQTQMNAAAAKPKIEMYTDVLNLAAIRDAAFAAPTPDCAQEAELTLSDAMSQAVSRLQAYFNGDVPDLGNIVTDANTKLDTVIAQQTELLNRLNAQFQQQVATATP